MSLDPDLEHLRVPPHDSAAYSYLVTCHTSNRTSFSAAPIDNSPSGILHDVITFLAAAQWREIDFLRIAGNLAQLLHLQGKLNAAEDATTQVYQALEKMLGASHPNTLAGANNLASVLRSRGKPRAAQTLYERTLDQCERHNGACHPSFLNILNSLAVIQKEQGHFDAAEKQLKQAISGRQVLFGRRHHETQASINNLAGVMM